MRTVLSVTALLLLVLSIGVCLASAADFRQVAEGTPVSVPWWAIAAGVGLLGMAFTSQAQGRDINSVMGGWKDRGPWIYYDSIYTLGGALQSSYQPFSIPIGGVDPITGATKTKLQTNMISGNNFGSSRCLVLEQLGFEFPSNVSKADIDLILNGCYFEFKIEDKIYFEGLLSFYPSGTGLSGVTGTSGESVYYIGFPVASFSRRYGNYSKYIAPLQQFSMTLYFPGTPPSISTALGTHVFIRPILDGLTDRSVQ